MASGRAHKPKGNEFRFGSNLHNGTGLHERPHDPFNPSNEPSTKRQKREESAIVSRFFSDGRKPKPRADTIEDEEDFNFKAQPERKPHPNRSLAHEVHDLTQDESQADSLEIVSVASTGITPVATGVVEYRNAQPPKFRPSGRRRRRRSQTPGSGRPPQDEVEDSRPSHNLLPPSTTSIPATSPDILSQDDPPPANVVSDIIPQHNPTKPGSASTKRVRRSTGAHDESEDELANHHSDTQKRTTNFSNITPPRPRQRGDIGQTAFSPARPTSQGQISASKLSSMPESKVTVVKAASGKEAYFCEEEPDTHIQLLLEKGSETAKCQVNGTVQSIPWLELKKPKILTVVHAATWCPILQIKRSTSPGAPASLVLEFKTTEEAVLFFDWVSFRNQITTQEKESLELERVLRSHFQHAKFYKNSSSMQPSTPSPVTPARPQDPRRRYLEHQNHAPTERLIDKMKPPSKDESEEHSIVAIPRGRGIETRRTRRLSPPALFYDLLPDRWTRKNPNWDKDWRMTLEFPANGKKRESVHKDDVSRLDEGEFLNDNLINFYLRYLQAQLEEKRPEVLSKVHFFNTFLFPTIKSGGGNINYKGVEKWTAKIDLFSYKYIVVPINESLHWYLAIIYNAPKLLPEVDAPTSPEPMDVDENTPAKITKSPVEGELDAMPLGDGTTESIARSQSSTGTLENISQIPLTKPSGKLSKMAQAGGVQKFSPEEPRIITLDSLGSPHSATCKALKSYLIEEARHKKNIELLTTPGGMTAKHIPAQDNHCDCGAFLLGYMEEFLKDPDDAVRRILQKEDLGWKIDASQVRTKVRDIIIKLQKEYQTGEEEKKQERIRQRKLARLAGQSVPSSPREPPPDVFKTPQSKREIKSPTPNGHGSPAVLRLQQVFKAEGSPKPNCSPERRASPHAHSSNEPNFVQSLEDDSSVGSKTTVISTEVIHSARSSPKGAAQIPVDLTTEQSSHAMDTTAMPSFVQGLPSSPIEIDSGARGIKRSRSETPEVSLVQMQTSRQPKASSIPPSNINTSQEVIPSIETDNKPSQNGPKYDGIDRSHKSNPSHDVSNSITL